MDLRNSPRDYWCGKDTMNLLKFKLLSVIDILTFNFGFQMQKFLSGCCLPRRKLGYLLAGSPWFLAWSNSWELESKISVEPEEAVEQLQSLTMYFFKDDSKPPTSSIFTSVLLISSIDAFTAKAFACILNLDKIDALQRPS